MLVTTLDWSDYVGRIAIGRIQSGRLKKNQNVALMQANDQTVTSRVNSVHVFENLGRQEVDEAQAGDIAAVVGLDGIEIGDTITINSVDLPAGTKPTIDRDFVIANIQAPSSLAASDDADDAEAEGGEEAAAEEDGEE